MNISEKHNKEYWIKKFDEYVWLRIAIYGAGTLLSIWIIGKSAKLLSVAITNIKNLNYAIQQYSATG